MPFPQIFLIIFFLATDFIFSGIETALASIELESNIEDLPIDEKSAKILKLWKIKPWRILNFLVICTNICTVAISLISVNLAINLSESLGVSQNFLLTLSSITAIMLVFLFGETFPKIIARNYPTLFFLKTIKFVLFFWDIMTPINNIFNKTMIWISGVFGFKIFMKKNLREQDINEILDLVEHEGSIDETEKELIESMMAFDELTAGSIMMPKSKMDCITLNENIESVLEKVKLWKHSRIPIYEGEIDNIVGLLYAKDLLVLKENRDLVILKDMLRPAYFIPPTKKVRKLLEEFKVGHYHLAVVVDEYGSVQGMLTIEDILEEIFGNILDEYDVLELSILKHKQGAFLVNGDIELDFLDDKLHLNLEKNCPDEVRTLSGFISFVSGKIPKKGEIIRYKNIVFWIKEVDRRVVKKVVLKVLNNIDLSETETDDN